MSGLAVLLNHMKVVRLESYSVFGEIRVIELTERAGE